MKCCIIFSGIIFFSCFRLSAQWVSVLDLREEIPDMALYRFPTFVEGTVTFRKGNTTPAKLNYNISNDEMRFLNQKGDTLIISNAPTINFISINGKKFYYDKGYLQAIDTANDIILAFRQTLTQEQQIKNPLKDIPAHEKETAHPFFKGDGSIYKLDDIENDHVFSQEFYYFGDVYGNFFNADKEFILNHFRKNQTAIKTFLKENRSNFNSLKDLQKLMEFCKTLP